jgi:hypothetical protein
MNSNGQLIKFNGREHKQHMDSVRIKPTKQTNFIRTNKGAVIKHMDETEVIKKHMIKFTRSCTDPAHSADLEPPPPFEWTR